MKLLRAIAVAMLALLLCLTPALAESRSARMQTIVDGIGNEIGFMKYPHDMIDLWMDEYTVAEWEAAAVMAVKEHHEGLQSGAFVMPMYFDWEGYLDGSFFESEEYLSILAQHGLTRTGSNRDLGDESIPMYILCAAAAVALGGMVFANKKRVCA